MSAVKIKKPNKTSLSLSRFGVIDNGREGNSGGFANAEFSANFDMKDGSLKSGIGLEAMYNADLPERCLGAWFYRRDDQLSGCDDRIIVMGRSGQFYESAVSDGNFNRIEGLVFTAKPVGVCYNYNGDDVIIFASADDGTFIYDGNRFFAVPDAPPITSACIHYERLFATTDGGKSLWFSDDFDPTNWSISLSEAGFIDMEGFRGEMLRVVSFLDYVYVFRSYGITRVSAYGDQTQFSVSDLFVSSGKICRDSITFCGDRIIFMASDGFYSFNGISATRILGGLDGTIDYGYGEVKGQFYDGKAYFIVNVNGENDSVGSLLVLDVQSGYYYIVNGVDVFDIQLIDGRFAYELCLLEGSGQRLLKVVDGGNDCGSAFAKVWESKFCDFGVNYPDKLLSKLSLYTSTDITVEITNGEQTAVFLIAGGKGRKTVRPNIRGDNFKIKINCREENACVSGLALAFEYYR